MNLIERIGRPWLAILGLAAVPVPGAAQGFGDRERAAVADTIRRQADRVITALQSKDVDRLMELFTTDPDLVYVDNGRIYPSRDALAAAAGGFFKRLGSATGEWDQVHVLPLSPTSGAFTGVLRPRMVDLDGKPLWVDGKIWTFVYQRRAGKWLIVQAHEVNALPPRG